MLTAPSQQSENRPTMPSKPRRNSSDPPFLSTPHARQRRPRVPASSPARALPPPSFQTSICLRTRFFSCGSWPPMSPKRVWRRSLAASKGSRKSERCLVAQVLLSSSTRPRLGLSMPRRLRRGWRWESRASPSVLRSRDSDARQVHENIALSSSWRWERTSSCVLGISRDYLTMLLPCSGFLRNVQV